MRSTAPLRRMLIDRVRDTASLGFLGLFSAYYRYLAAMMGEPGSLGWNSLVDGC